MTVWKYVGCDVKMLPKELYGSDKFSNDQIKQLLADMPLIRGEIEAVTVDAVTALLMADNILPLKLHPLDMHESSLNRLKRLRSKFK